MTDVITSTHELLIVDDNRSVHEDIERVLMGRCRNSDLDELEARLFSAPPAGRERSEFHLHFASQGEEAVGLVQGLRAEGTQVSLAFVDMRMPPGWDGVETIEGLWECDPNIQVVICTSYSDHPWLDIIKRLPRHDQLLILKKPIDPMEILQATAALTRKWTLQRTAEDHVEHLNRLVMERTRQVTEANAQLQSRLDELHRMEAELRLAQRLEAIGQLAAGVAHEINTPAQFVADNLTFLAESWDEVRSLLPRVFEAEAAPSSGAPASSSQDNMAFLLQEVPKAIEQSREGMERIASIVRAMKHFSHPGGDAMKRTKINEAIESTVTVSRNEWKYVASVDLELDPNLPEVWCYPGELNQVFLNLMVNAAHAIQERMKKEGGEMGRIVVRTSVVDGGVEVSVSDTGCGIPAAIRGRIYDPFFTTKDVGKGTGQGLSMAHNVIVNRHKGSLRFESEEGRGTTFYIRLKSRQQEAA